MRKVIILSLFLCFLFLPSVSLAYEDTAERYTSDISNYYSTTTSNSGAGAVSSLVDPSNTQNTVIKLRSSLNTNVIGSYTQKTYLIPKTTMSPYYFSCISTGFEHEDYWDYPNRVRMGFIFQVRNPSDNSIIAQFSPLETHNYNYPQKIEIVKSGTSYELYINGSKIETVSNTQPTYSDNVYYCPGTAIYKLTSSSGVTGSGSVYYDDLTDSSIIGIKNTYTESSANVFFTWSSQLMRSYTDQQKITLYSLTNPSNAGLVTSWNIPQDDNSTTSEHGYFSFSRSQIIGDNFGLYLLEMTRGDDILTDQYFYYDQLSNPNGYPELLFLGESSVKTEIRDDNHNGGEIQGGGSVYLYPKIKEDAVYNFTYNILEAPYKIRTELTNIYNNTLINSTTIHYTGLSNQNYGISVDGADAGSTNGADTFSYTFTDWGTEKNHIISFAPDYTIAGVWGEVKNSETQAGIKSATVSITGENFSKTLYTDDNGLYYLTKGMEPGKTYTITVSKTGYTTPPSQTAITADGSTTRQDFYMDKIPGVDGEGLYYSPHNVRFVVTDRYLFERYDANVTISGENTTTETQRTGTDGVCVFKMTENTRYEIVTEYNGMKQTDYISPIEYSYYIILDATKTSLLPTSQFYEMCNITITKNELNSSHAEIAASYSDTGSDTRSVYFTLGKTDGNNTMNALETSPTGNGNMTYTFVVQDYIGEDYVVKVNVDHNKFGNVEKQYGVNFPGSKLPFTGNAIIALCVLIFFVVAMQWGKADAHMGAVLICGLGWWFYYLDIFRKLGDGTNAVIGTGLGLATVYAILSMINRKRDEGGI